MSPKKVQGTKTELSCGTEYNYCAFEGLRGERDMKLLRLLAMLMLGFNSTKLLKEDSLLD